MDHPYVQKRFQRHFADEVAGEDKEVACHCRLYLWETEDRAGGCVIVKSVRGEYVWLGRQRGKIWILGKPILKGFG